MNRRPQKGIRVSKPSYARHVSQLLAIAFGFLATLVLGVASASAAAPSVTIEPASEVGYTTATVNGEVDPEACSNEALRSENGSLGLPDCRAYELVTPLAA